MGNPEKKKSAKPRHKPRLSWSLVATVVALQLLLLATLLMTNQWQPPKARVFEALWSWAREASIYPMLLLLIGGPLLTFLALRLDRGKVAPLFAAWAAFGLTLVIGFGAEAQQMLVSIWRSVSL